MISGSKWQLARLAGDIDKGHGGDRKNGAHSLAERAGRYLAGQQIRQSLCSYVCKHPTPAVCIEAEIPPIPIRARLALRVAPYCGRQKYLHPPHLHIFLHIFWSYTQLNRQTALIYVRRRQFIYTGCRSLGLAHAACRATGGPFGGDTHDTHSGK